MINLLKASSKASTALRSAAVLSLTALSMCVVGASANAAPMITNGTFTSSATDSFLLGNGSSVSGWSLTNPTSSVNCLDVGGLSDICGTSYNSGEKVWVNPGVSPAGGNAFVSVAGVALPLSQTVSGLTVGTTYAVSFYQAASEVYADGAVTTESWAVSLDGSTVSSPTMSTPFEGGTPWQQVTVDFTANSASETLSFLAHGAPLGGPPTAFLSGVSIAVAAPEPSAAALFGLSVIALLGLYKTRSRSSAAI